MMKSAELPILFWHPLHSCWHMYRPCLLGLESGEKVPFALDTGSPWTLLDTSLEPKLGKSIGTGTTWNMGVKRETGRYATPKLYLGSTLLIMTRTNIATYDCRTLSSKVGRPFLGVLGMDFLKQYCIQLDFAARKLRFLDDEHANKKGWGKPFALTDLGDECCVVSENLAGAKGMGSLIDTGCNGDGWLIPQLFQQWTNQATLPSGVETRSLNGVLGGDTYCLVLSIDDTVCLKE